MYLFFIIKGKEIIGHFLEQLKDEGITSVPRWQPPSEEADACSTADDQSTDGDCLASCSERFEDNNNTKEECNNTDEDEDNVTVRDTESPLKDGVADITLEDGGEEVFLKREKELADSASKKKERKDSLGASASARRDKKKKDSVSSGVREKKEDGEERAKGATKKISLCKTESLSIEDGKCISFDIFTALLK